MKKQRIIHIGTAILLTAAVLVSVHFLPPYLKHNPGILMLVCTFILAEVGHFVFHGQ
jgi:hypothetical protein